jgi:glycosyltransferase involved in cell wall biosynthesis
LVRSGRIDATVSVIRNNCDLEQFHRVAFDREAFLRRLKIPTDVPLLLTVGRLATRKSHMTIMRALARLDIPFHWLVVGEGNERTALNMAKFVYRLGAKVSMPGWLDENDLVLSYNAADMFVLTPIERMVRGGLDSEGFGLVYHEAGACGTPCIASDVSGCREAVLHDRTGLLVPPGNPELLSTAIRKLLTDEELRSRLGVAAEVHVRAQGGWQAVCGKLIDIYHAVLATHGRQEIPCARGTVPAHG